MKRYTRNFYDGQRERSRISAQEIVPFVIELVRPESVVDVGCGSGAWLSVFRDQGVEDIFGVDGAWVDTDRLFIPAARFVQADLSQPVTLDRRFDLVMSLEVAEHIPPDRAAPFVDSLSMLGPVVLFSAAIPGQGGTHHVNEQWPDYWVGLFKKRGFRVIDCIREKVWRNENVEWWYAQNTFLFVDNDRLDHFPLLQRAFERTGPVPLALVHPRQYLASKDPKNMSLGPVLSALPKLIMQSAKELLKTWK